MAENETTIEEFLADLDGLSDEEIATAISELDEDSQTALFDYLETISEDLEEEDISNDEIIAYGPRVMIDAIAAGDGKSAVSAFDDILTAKISDFLDDARLAVAESLLDSDINDEADLETFVEGFVPLTESASHGDHHQTFADLTHSAQQLANITNSGFMHNELTKEDKKEIMTHHKSAVGNLDNASSTLGDRDSMNYLNKAAIHLTNGHNAYHSLVKRDWRTPGTTVGTAATA